MSPRNQLMRELNKIGVVEQRVPGRDDGFAGLVFRGKDIGHFHDDHEVDLRLGKQLIAREKLKHPPDSRVHPKRAKSSPWIELPLFTTAHVKEVTRLVNLVISRLDQT